MIIDELIAKALGFSACAHFGQKRKYTGEDYFLHCQEVASIVMNHGYRELTIPAYLHDVLEDTAITEDYLIKHFMANDVRTVVALTEKPLSFGNRAKRKADNIERLTFAGWDAQTIKYADIISNSHSIREFDPDFWEVYKRECIELLDALSVGCYELRKKAYDALY